MRTRLRFEPPPGEIVGTGRNHHAGRNLKRSSQEFKVWIPVEFETVAGFHSDVHWRHEVVPAFHLPMQVGDVAKLILKEFLSNPTEGSIFRGPGLPCTIGFRVPSSRTR